jgi:hypothetical protein
MECPRRLLEAQGERLYEEMLVPKDWHEAKLAAMPIRFAIGTV